MPVPITHVTVATDALDSQPLLTHWSMQVTLEK